MKRVGANLSFPSLPPEIKVTPIRDQETLAGMLASGELAALVSAREPSCFSPQNPEIVRLFPDFRAAERAWYDKNDYFQSCMFWQFERIL